MSRGLEGAQLAPGGRRGRAGRGTARRSTNASNSSSAMPACCAPASVGHSVEHQRRLSVCSRIGARARASAREPRRGRRRRARGVVGRLDAERRVEPLAPPRRRGAGSRRAGSRARARRSRRSGRAARRAAAASAPRSRIARCSSSSSGAASVVERTRTCWRSADVQAVAAQQLGERRGVERTSSAQRRSSSRGRARAALDRRACGSPRALAHDADPPRLAGERPEAAADLDAVLEQQRAAHRGLVDALGHAHAQQRGAAARRRAPGARSPRSARAPRSASWRVAWRAQRASRPSSCTIASASSQRVDDVDRRGVVVGARAAAAGPVAEHSVRSKYQERPCCQALQRALADRERREARRARSGTSASR